MDVRTSFARRSRALLCLAVVGCGGSPAVRDSGQREVVLALASTLPATMGPVRWTLYVERRRAWGGDSSSDPVTVQVALPRDARLVQLAAEAEGVGDCARAHVRAELSRVVDSAARTIALDVALFAGDDGMVRLRSRHRGMARTEDLSTQPGAAPPAHADDEALAELLADLLVQARRSGDLTAVACVRRRVDEAAALLDGEHPRSRSRPAIGLSARTRLEAPSQTARLRALASAAAQCPLHGYAPAVRLEDRVDVAGPPRCGVRPSVERVSIDIEADSPTRGAEQRYPRPLPPVPSRSGQDTVEVTVDRMP